MDSLSLPTREYSTGLDALDRSIGADSMSAFSSGSGEFPERAVLTDVIAAHRTVFVSTTRHEREVRDWLERTVTGPSKLTVHTASVDELLADPLGVLDPFPRELLHIIGPVDPLEADSRERSLAASMRSKNGSGRPPASASLAASNRTARRRIGN